MLNVCVPVLNRYDLARKMLESLRCSTLVPDAVYVMNNGMDRVATEALIGIIPYTVVINPNRPLGVAESWNWFINNVEGDRIITNDDIEFAPESLARMVESPLDFVSCTFGFSCFLLRDACIARVGLFDEEISPGYGYFEDMDYLRRMKAAGVEDAVVSCGVVHHQSSTPRAFTPAQRHAHDTRFLLAQTNYAKKWAEGPDWELLRGIGGHGEHKTVTYLVASVGRSSLARTLESIKTYVGDEILVVGSMGDAVDPRVTFIPCGPGGDWGHTERNFTTPLAKGDYIAHIDDDDVYAPGTRALMSDAMTNTPDRPVLFRMRFPNGITLWQDQALRCGNVGTPMMLIPNVPERLGKWLPFVGGDYAFLEACKWAPEDFVWRPEVIALLGHNT